MVTGMRVARGGLSFSGRPLISRVGLNSDHYHYGQGRQVLGRDGVTM